MSTSLRLYVRRFMTIRRWGLEDYIITGAWVYFLFNVLISIADFVELPVNPVRNDSQQRTSA